MNVTNPRSIAAAAIALCLAALLAVAATASARSAGAGKGSETDDGSPAVTGTVRRISVPLPRSTSSCSPAESERLIGVFPISLPRWITSTLVPGVATLTSPVAAGRAANE